MSMRNAVATRDSPPSESGRARGGIRFENVSKAFLSRADAEPFVAVQDVDLEIESGKFVCLIGPSGSGKSTLLNMVAGLFAPSAGTVSYDGQTVSGVNTRVGYITQQDNLLAWRTLEQNISLALEIQGVPRAERQRRVREMIELVGLSGFEKNFPAQLSGGMRKRATLARTLIYAPQTLLMDEPFGALDAMLKNTMQTELLRLWERDRKTVLFVTHDLEEAILLADTIVVFGTNPGRIVHVEDVSFERPRDLVSIRQTSDFGAVWQRLWNIIEDGQRKPGTEEQAS
ncbi:ABC transporter ATP-binding protein [Microbacterium sp. MAHUQ-60]|uniref:ABC transporter ATP-binding protein n=1 Tax=unclassified Microbacterium TaxID=2609290 RepID=UPI003618CAC3